MLISIKKKKDLHNVLRKYSNVTVEMHKTLPKVLKPPQCNKNICITFEYGRWHILFYNHWLEWNNKFEGIRNIFSEIMLTFVKYRFCEEPKNNIYCVIAMMCHLHNSEDTGAPWYLQSLENRLFFQHLVKKATRKISMPSALLAFCWGIHRSPVNPPHKGSVMRKACPCHDVMMV